MKLNCMMNTGINTKPEKNPINPIHKYVKLYICWDVCLLVILIPITL